MEKFINNLYSNSNFPIILVSLIAIFTVLFVITLILALKDAKNSSKEENSLDNDNKNLDKVEFKESKKEVAEEPKVFEDISFDKEEEKNVDTSNLDKIAFAEPQAAPTDNDKEEVDVITETTQTIPVLKDDEISNFEEFFLQNLKDKKEDNNIFDFSKKEEEPEVESPKNFSEEGTDLEDVQVTLESAFEVHDINDTVENVNTEDAPINMEMPKIKKEYTFKELDGESYRLR